MLEKPRLSVPKTEGKHADQRPMQNAQELNIRGDYMTIRTLTDVEPIPVCKARIYFFRSARLWGAALAPRVLLDGSPEGKAVPARFFYKDVAPGSHEVTVRTVVTRKLCFNLEAGEARYVKFSVGFGCIIGLFRIEAIDPDVAREEMKRISALT